jgi:glutamate 5-kinase
VVIADGRAREIALRAASGEPVGTHFLPTGDRTESRRRYLLSGMQVRGRVMIDGGAARALRTGGTSLLPAGVTKAEGDFARGDVVHLFGPDGEHIATGLANYDRAEIEQISGKHSDQIVKVLGYEYSEEIVHRNNLVLV